MDEIKTNETRENLIKKGKFQQIENISKIPMNILFLKILFIYLFRGEGKEKERERHIYVWLLLMCPQLGTWPAIQACALTGNRTDDPLLHRPALNPLSYTSQGSNGNFRTKNQNNQKKKNKKKKKLNRWAQ